MFLKFPSPSNFLLAGMTQSGKSFWGKRLIENKEQMFQIPPKRVVYVYSTFQPLFKELQSLGVKFHEGLPTKEQLEQWTISRDHLLLFLDDVITSACNSLDIVTLFTVTSHHRNVTTVLMLQTVFAPCFRYARVLSLNSHFFVLFNTKRDRQQIVNLGKQIFPNQSNYFMTCYEDACSEPYGYLLCDLHPATDKKFMLRTRIFPGEVTWFYGPNKEGEESETYSFSV